MNKQEFKDVMEGLKALYGDKIPDMNGFAREIWYECLSDMDFEKIKKAITNHIKSSKFPPTVADIREQYRLILSETQDLNNCIEETFSEMQGYYPSGADDKSARGTFFTKLLMIETNCKLKYAESIKNKVIDYVKNCESTTGEITMTLSECIKWAVEK